MNKGNYSAAGFHIIPLLEDPLGGAYGLSWFERKPSSLTQAEWAKLDNSVTSRKILAHEYFDWKTNVR